MSTAVEPLARYYFVPAVREGLAAYITAETAACHRLPDGDLVCGERAVIDARLVPVVDEEDRPADVVPMKVGLFGPGDVLGLDALVVTRTDPRPNVWDFEPNFMPLVELSEPDLPWRFTPDVARSDGSGRLTPWIALVVLKQGEYAGLDERLPDDRATNSLPIRWITGVSKAALPDFDTLWRWAHVHITDASDLGSTDTPQNQLALQSAVAERISADPGSHDAHIVARLICPRRLEATTAYTAFVVPTFKMGQVAAGLAVLQDGESGVTPGWDESDIGISTVDLPYYYRFEFGTSVKGNFEYLVRLLEPRLLEGLGKRRMDCKEMRYELGDCPGRAPDDPHVLDLEGALMSPTVVPGEWHNETADIETFRIKLADVLNRTVNRSEPGKVDGDAADPLVVPPVFGRRHAQQFQVDSAADGRWLDDVNLDPRQRAAAGFGSAVVEKEQEALMASVWDQLGHIEDANQAIAHGQLGLEASKGVFERLSILSLADFLWTCAPVLARVPFSGSGTVANHLQQSPIPTAAFDPAFRRVIRRGGGIRKRQQRSDRPPPTGRDFLSRLNERDVAAAGTPPKVPGIPTMCDITDRAVEILERESEPQRRASGRYRIFGRVVDRFSHNSIRGVRVEAWDRDPFVTDLIGTAVTNERGWFRIEFDRTYHAEWSLDRTPDVYFKVMRGDDALAVTAPGVLRDLEAGDTTVTVEIDQTPGFTAHLPFRLTGQVLDRSTRAGIAWLRVEAWDRDVLADDLVGSAVTDAQGAFTVAFHRSYSKEWFLDRAPDLYVKVFRGRELLASTASDAKSNVKRGDTAVVVVIDAPAALPAAPGSRATDFCEPAITCDAVRQAVAGDPTLAPLGEVAEAICSGLAGWLDLTRPEDTRPSVDLIAVRETVERAIAPAVTIPARVMKRLHLRPGVHQRAVLARLESEVDFPQPMYEPLAAISQDLILPGVETVPQNTISILKTNRRFMESYMLGLNDSVSSEIIWRGAPVYVWTTCFRQFWDVSGLPAPEADSDAYRDITRIARWPRRSALGVHDPRAPSGVTPEGAAIDRAVLLVRGDVLKRYPNTLVYLIPAAADGRPALAEFQDGDEAERIWPIFSGSLPPDLTFLGFNLTPTEMCTGASGRGVFVVLEERLAEPRFGFDLQQDESEEPDPLPADNWWYDMTWSHLQPDAPPGAYIDDRSFAEASVRTPTWGTSAAVMANIALQRPVRICVHASRMLPRSVCVPQP